MRGRILALHHMVCAKPLWLKCPTPTRSRREMTEVRVRVARASSNLPAVPADALRRLAVAASCTVMRHVLLTGALCAGHVAHAQELNPRAYVITPVGINVSNLGYSHLEGN